MLKPTFKLIYENKDITKDVSDFVVDISYTDNEHGTSDEIQIQFEDSQKLWQGSWIPVKGDRVRLFLGYEGEKLLNCGLFEIDEIEFQTPPDTITLKAIATSIKKSLRQNNSVAYENKTLKQIAQEIAKKHGYKLCGNVAAVKAQRITQNQEYDLAFLKKLAEQYGYIFKVAENNLVFYKVDELENAKPTQVFSVSDFSRLSLSEKTSQLYKACTVSYHNPKTGKKISATVKNEGVVNGDTLKITERCETKEQAILKAKAALKKGKQGIEGGFEMAGSPYIIAGINIEIKDVGHFAGKYHIKTATHTISRDRGYAVRGEIKSC